MWKDSKVAARALWTGALLGALSLGCSAAGKDRSAARDAAGGAPGSGGGSAVAVASAGAGAGLNLTPGEGSGNSNPGGTQNGGRCLPEPFPKDYRCEGQEGPWAEALQKVLWFFNVQKSGPGVECTDVQWRGDAHVADGRIRLDPSAPNGVNLPQQFIDQHRAELDPDGDGTVDLAGGYHDAGDYIKFTLTTTYAASMIAWSMYEYPEAYQKTGLASEALGQIRWAADYLMKATFRDADGKLVAYAHQVSDATDHSCFWMPPEVRRPELCPRKAYFVWDGKPAADVTASAAAALTLTALVVEANRTSPADTEYAKRCLDYAKSLYAFAKQNPLAREGDDGGLYLSNSSTDDLAWAAVWLYLADPGQNRAYLDDVIHGETPWLSFGTQTTLLYKSAQTGDWVPAWAESSPHSWDAVRAGVITKLAQITTQNGDPQGAAWKDIARQMAQGFTKGGHTPDGFYVYMSWGSARYNAAAQFTTLLYTKYFPDDENSAALRTWADRQIDYVLGKNDLGKSFIMGYTESYPLQPHHAAGHASIYGLPAKPAENRHIIWGALVNGPGPDGKHVDARDDFGSNEVTIDYNGALVAALAAHVARRGAGQCPLKAFPPLEAPIDEFYALANLNTKGDCRTQVNIRTMNETIHPPRYDETLTVRYWLDVSEVVAAGLDPATSITGQVLRDTGLNATPPEPVGVKGPIACEEAKTTYYFEFDYTGDKFWGLIPAIGGPRDLLFEYGLPWGATCPWDPSNDWSVQALELGQTEQVAKTKNITVYSKGTLIWGNEPPCNGEQKITPPPPEISYPPR